MNKMNDTVKGIISYLAIAIGIIGIYLLARATGLEKNQQIVQYGMLGILAIIFVIAAFKCIKKQADAATIAKYLIFAGIVIRIGYMIYTGCETRAHDMWEFEAASGGQAGYILKLMQEKALPDSIIRQFYQQPLYYVVAACVSGIINLISGNSDVWYTVDAAKTVSCIASCYQLLITYQICKKCDLNKGGMLVAMSATASWPIFYFAGGRVAIDSFVAMLATIIIYRIILWNENSNIKNAVGMIIAIIAGMLAKTGLIAMVMLVEVLFILKMLESKNDKNINIMPYVIENIVLLVSSATIGMWYRIRWNIKFDMSLTYTVDLGKDSSLYLGKNSLFERFILIDIPNMVKNVFANVADDVNLPIYMLKTSLFGEFKHSIFGIVPVGLLLFGFILMIAAVIAVIWQITFNKNNKNMQVVAIGSVIYYISFVIYNIKSPYGCNMDFRQVIALAAFMAIILGAMYEKIQNNTVRKIINVSTTAFVLFSIMMVCFIR